MSKLRTARNMLLVVILLGLATMVWSIQTAQEVGATAGSGGGGNTRCQVVQVSGSGLSTGTYPAGVWTTGKTSVNVDTLTGFTLFRTKWQGCGVADSADTSFVFPRGDWNPAQPWGGGNWLAVYQSNTDGDTLCVCIDGLVGSKWVAIKTFYCPSGKITGLQDDGTALTQAWKYDKLRARLGDGNGVDLMTGAARIHNVHVAVFYHELK